MPDISLTRAPLVIRRTRARSGEVVSATWNSEPVVTATVRPGQPRQFIDDAGALVLTVADDGATQYCVTGSEGQPLGTIARVVGVREMWRVAATNGPAWSGAVDSMTTSARKIISCARPPSHLAFRREPTPARGRPDFTVTLGRGRTTTIAAEVDDLTWQLAVAIGEVVRR